MLEMIRLLIAVSFLVMMGYCPPCIAQVVQCGGNGNFGCNGLAPLWDVRWDMAGSGYIYCWENCPMEWLANNTNLGVYGGVLGVDHYWTHQGMPCINGIPQEFAMQDAYAAAQKKLFPRIKVLQYRILNAVPYAEVVHDKMVSDPTAFIRWHHPPNDNGSICAMPSVEHKTEGFNCSWEIRAAAYDLAQPSVQEWVLNNIIKPTLAVADGPWIDNMDPDNGAWMCTGTHDYSNLPAPYPPLNKTEIATFCSGAETLLTAAHEWLLPKGGYDYNCFTFVDRNTSLPIQGDTAEECAKKLQSLDHMGPAVVLYGDRTKSWFYNDSTAAEAIAVFLLTRDQHWFFGYPSANKLNTSTAALLLSDFGPPLGNMTRPDPKTYVFHRQYTKMNVSLDCATFTAKYTPSEIPLKDSLFIPKNLSSKAGQDIDEGRVD